MKHFLTLLGLSAALLLSLRGAFADATFTVDTAATWQGFMNVFELPINGGAYVFGSPWGTADLVAVFNAEETVLTLAPNSVNDPDPFWYTPSGGPGSMGNKITDANFYVEAPVGTLAGETIAFEGNVLSNTLTSSHTARAFIRDFAPDYSSFNESSLVLTPGPFSINLFTDPSPGRHVQYGFNFNGPCVWITDVGPYGTVTVESIPSPEGQPGDFDGDTDVDGRDFLIWQRGGTTPVLDPALLADWQNNYGTSGPASLSAVPEPAGMLLLVIGACSLTIGRRR